MTAPARSWAPTADDEPTYQPPSPLAVVVAVAALVVALVALAVTDHDCRQWAGDRPDRVAECDRLSR